MNKKAVVLLSGGLDSAVSLKLMLDQGIECIGIKFSSPFCTCDNDGHCHSKVLAEQFNIKYITLPKGLDYLEIIKKPKFGYGKGLNPCIDCRIYILKKAKEKMDELGAEIIVTGEVLGQRPMSQHKLALEIIEKESGLKGKLLRPLSAKFLSETDAARECVIDISKFPEITGRGRKKQIELSKIFNIEDYSCAGGGCLLTQEYFAVKLKDLIDNQKDITQKDLLVLKIGRHFRFGSSKIIAGRNEEENKKLNLFKNEVDYHFQTVEDTGPDVILSGDKSMETIMFAAKIVAFFSKSDRKIIKIKYGNDRITDIIEVERPLEEEIAPYNLVNKKLDKKTVSYK